MNSLKVNNKVRHNIITKTTSLALASILITSMFVGLIPLVVMPAAAANTYLSVSQTHIGNDNVIMVTIDDSALADHPAVTLTYGSTTVTYTSNMLKTNLGQWILPISNSSSSQAVATAQSVLNGTWDDTWIQSPNFGAETTATLTYQDRGESVALTIGESAIGTPTVDRADIPKNSTMHVTVSDPTENLDPTANDTKTYTIIVQVNGVNQTAPVSIDATETDVNTGLFKGSVDLSLVGPVLKQNWIITVVVFDDDVATTEKTVDAQVKLSDGSISVLPAATFRYNGEITVSVIDADRNLNTLATDTPAINGNFIVKVSATINGSVKTGNLALAETGINTGNFTGTIAATLGGDNTEALSGNATTTLTATVPMGTGASFVVNYTDPVSLTVGRWSSATFSLTHTKASVAFDSTTYIEASSMPAVLSLTEPDANIDSTKIERLTVTNMTDVGGTIGLNVTHADYPNIAIGKLNITSTTGSTTTTLAITTDLVAFIETGRDTGVFELTLDLALDLSGTRTSDDSIKASYVDRFASGGTVTNTITLGGTLATLEIDQTELPVKLGSAVTIAVTLTDPDENGNPAAVDTATVSVSARNATQQDIYVGTSASQTLTLTETGVNTAIFKADLVYTIASSTGAVTVTLDAAHTLTEADGTTTEEGRAMIGGKLNVSYTEALAPNSRGVVTAVGTVTAHTATLAVNETSTTLNTNILYTLTDPDQNDAADTKDTVSISLFDGVAQTFITLTETAVSTGIFEKVITVGVTTGSTTFSAGETINANYTDTANALSYYATSFTASDLTAATAIPSNDAVVTLDATNYGPLSEVVVTVTDPDLALTAASAVKLSLIKTSLADVENMAATNKRTDGVGVFQFNFTLYVAGETTQDVLTALVDTMTIYYVDTINAAGVAGVITTISATISSTTGTVSVTPSAILVGNFMTVSVTDADQNAAPLVIESVTVLVITDSWPLGKNVTLPETGVDTGIFETMVQVIAGIPATDRNEVRGTTGDGVTVNYVDNWDAAGIRSTITVTAIVGVSVPPLERVPAGTPAAVDSNGAAAAPVVGTVSVLQAEVCNNDAVTHTFTYIVQIKDANGVVVSINWIQGNSLAAGSCVTPGISWTPDSAGEYTIEVFVWESLSNAVALSPVSTLTVTAV